MDRYPSLAIIFFGKNSVQDFRHSPITFSTTGKFFCFPMFHSQCFQHSILCFNFLPLFPIDCTNSTSCPFVRCFEKSFHICKSKVFHPSSHILLVLLFSYCIANAFVSIKGITEILDFADVATFVFFLFTFRSSFPSINGMMFFKVLSALFLLLQKIIQ